MRLLVLRVAAVRNNQSSDRRERSRRFPLQEVPVRAREFIDQFLIKHEFIKRLHARYLRDGITIPFPTQTVQTKTTE